MEAHGQAQAQPQAQAQAPAGADLGRQQAPPGDALRAAEEVRVYAQRSWQQRRAPAACWRGRGRLAA